VEQQLAPRRNRSAHTCRRHLGHPLSNVHGALHDYDGCMAVAKDLTAKLWRFKERRQRRYSVMGILRTKPFAMRRLRFAAQQYWLGDVAYGPEATTVRRSKIGPFDNLVGRRERRRRDDQTKRLGCLEIDGEIELGRLHDRQVGRLLSLENPLDLNADLPIGVGETGAAAHKTAVRGKLARL
jgi:hypothetical protein